MTNTARHGTAPLVRQEVAKCEVVARKEDQATEAAEVKGGCEAVTLRLTNTFGPCRSRPPWNGLEVAGRSAGKGPCWGGFSKL